MQEDSFITGIDLQTALTARSLRCGQPALRATGLLLDDHEQAVLLQAARHALSELDDDQDPYASDFSLARTKAIAVSFASSLSKALHGERTELVKAWCRRLVRARNEAEWYELFLRCGDLLRALSRNESLSSQAMRIRAIFGQYLQNASDESIRLSIEIPADEYDKMAARKYSRETPPSDSLAQLIWFTRLQELIAAVSK